MCALCAQEESLQAMLVGKYEGKALGCIELDGNRPPNRGGLPLRDFWGSFDKVGKSHRRGEFDLLMLRLLRTEAVARGFDYPTGCPASDEGEGDDDDQPDRHASA